MPKEIGKILRSFFSRKFGENLEKEIFLAIEFSHLNFEITNAKENPDGPYKPHFFISHIHNLILSDLLTYALDFWSGE